MPVYLILQDCTQSESLVDSMDGPDMIEILICKLRFQNYPQEKFFKLLGMEHQFSLEDSPLPKSIKRTSNILQILFSIRENKCYWVRLVTLPFWCVQQFVHIWVAFPFHIWVLIMDTSASATVQSTINSVELDKAQLFKTYHILTIPFMKMEHFFASKKWSIQENHQWLSGRD
jgi:hypothetical protein